MPALFIRNYKIIHLAGHGTFDPLNEENSGMLIGDNTYLTPSVINQLPSTPELVFVNCCFLGAMESRAEKKSQSRYKLAANIGTQLIDNGVKAVVVAGWAVDDLAALQFSKLFYEAMFAGETFGDAVHLARKQSTRIFQIPIPGALTSVMEILFINSAKKSAGKKNTRLLSRKKRKSSSTTYSMNCIPANMHRTKFLKEWPPSLKQLTNPACAMQVSRSRKD